MFDLARDGQVEVLSKLLQIHQPIPVAIYLGKPIQKIFHTLKFDTGRDTIRKTWCSEQLQEIFFLLVNLSIRVDFHCPIIFTSVRTYI